MKTKRLKTGNVFQITFYAALLFVPMFFAQPTNAQSIITDDFSEFQNSQYDNSDYRNEIYEIVDNYPEFSFKYSIDENGEVQNVEITGVNDEMDQKKVEIALLNLASDQNKAKHQDERIGVFYSVDQKPVPKGGEAKLTQTIRNNLVYPQDAKDRGLGGMVYVQFVVDENGNIPFISTSEDIKTHRTDLIKEFEQDAVSAVKATSGEWKPGKVEGVNVATLVEVPVSFEFEKDPFPVALIE